MCIQNCPQTNLLYVFLTNCRSNATYHSEKFLLLVVDSQFFVELRPPLVRINLRVTTTNGVTTMSAVPLTDSVADIRERKEKVVESVKHLGIATLYACLVFVLSMTAFLGSSYFLVPAPEHQSIATNFSND